MGDLAAFLGIHRNNVRRGLIRLGAIPENRRDLPSLRPRRAEFVRLNRMRGAERFQNQEDAVPADGPWNDNDTQGGGLHE